MLKILVKKQLMEVFRGYFYDAKKNKGRSKAAIIGFFIFFVVIMVGVLGGMFSYLSFSLCSPLSYLGLGWLYYAIMGLLAIFLGVFGSVFNTYASLYESKDNDMLLSMPIPVKSIVFSRLINVFLMGTMYSILVILPSVIVYWIVMPASAASIIGGIAMMLFVIMVVFVLSCLLGWVVAQISKKLKNKSLITVIVSLVFIGLYYFVYFKAQGVIQYILNNAMEVGDKVKGSAYGVYFVGSMATGSAISIIVCLALVFACAALVVSVMIKTFLKVVTATGVVKKAEYKETKAKKRSVFGAVFLKELGRFLGSANYMLNCGLGILLLPVVGILLFINGSAINDFMDMVFGSVPGAISVILMVAIMGICAMNLIVVPSVSLEGKSLWILQSLPIPTKTILGAKLSLQLVLTGVPMLLAVCGSIVAARASFVEALLLILASYAFLLYHTAFGLTIGLLLPNLSWTNEAAPIKQSLSVFIVMFGDLIVVVVIAALYLMILSSVVAARLYMLCVFAVLSLASILLLLWIFKKGTKRYEKL